MEGTRLRTARHNAGLSMRELALRMGVSPQTVFRWETNKTSFPEKYKRILLTALSAVPFAESNIAPRNLLLDQAWMRKTMKNVHPHRWSPKEWGVYLRNLRWFAAEWEQFEQGAGRRGPDGAEDYNDLV